MVAPLRELGCADGIPQPGVDQPLVQCRAVGLVQRFPDCLDGALGRRRRLGGNSRSDRPRRILLESGDVVVWGGPDRLVYHGVAPLPDGDDPLFGNRRINLTFRKAL